MIVQLIAKPQIVSSDTTWADWECRADQMNGPAGQKLIELAGRIKEHSFGVGKNSSAFVTDTMARGEGGYLEHASYTFFVKDISLTSMAILRQVPIAMTVGYCGDTVIHPLISAFFQNHPVLLRDFRSLEADLNGLHDEARDKLREDLIHKGIDPVTAIKWSANATRMYRSACSSVELLITVNVRTIRHLIENFTSPTSDAELRLFAIQLLDIMQEELPAYFDDYDMMFTSEQSISATTDYPKI